MPPKYPAYYQTEYDGQDGHQKGNPTAVNNTGENIATVVIGTQKMLPAGPGLHVGEVLLGIVVGGNEVGENGGEHQNKHDNQPQHSQLIPAKPTPDVPELTALFEILQLRALVYSSGLGLGRYTTHLDASFVFFRLPPVYWAIILGSAMP